MTIRATLATEDMSRSAKYAAFVDAERIERQAFIAGIETQLRLNPSMTHKPEADRIKIMDELFLQLQTPFKIPSLEEFNEIQNLKSVTTTAANSRSSSPNPDSFTISSEYLDGLIGRWIR